MGFSPHFPYKKTCSMWLHVTKIPTLSTTFWNKFPHTKTFCSSSARFCPVVQSYWILIERKSEYFWKRDTCVSVCEWMWKSYHFSWANVTFSKHILVCYIAGEHSHSNFSLHSVLMFWVMIWSHQYLSVTHDWGFPGLYSNWYSSICHTWHDNSVITLFCSY